MTYTVTNVEIQKKGNIGKKYTNKKTSFSTVPCHITFDLQVNKNQVFSIFR